MLEVCRQHIHVLATMAGYYTHHMQFTFLSFGFQWTNGYPISVNVVTAPNVGIISFLTYFQAIKKNVTW